MSDFIVALLLVCLELVVVVVMTDGLCRAEEYEAREPGVDKSAVNSE